MIKLDKGFLEHLAARILNTERCKPIAGRPRLGITLL